MKRFILWVVVYSALLTNVKAQSVRGVVVDKADNTPLPGATVNLHRQLDSTVSTTITNKNGVFVFENINSGNYTLKISSVGYEVLENPVVLSDSSIDVGRLSIAKVAKVLTPVTINSSAPPVRQKVDTLEYSANAFKVNPDANAEDMLKKMPGVTVDKGTVTAHGETVRKVTIDGKEFFGDDVTAALRNMPSEVIDKIQVFDRLSDQAAFTGFDDGSAVKAINIVTKADMRNGQFGRVYAGYGTDDRYSAGGNVSFFKDNRRISLVGLFNNINQQNFSSQDLLGVTGSQNRGGGGNRGGRGGPGGFQGGGGRFMGDANNFLVGQQSGISTTNAFGINYSNVLGKKVTVTGSYFFNNSRTPNTEITNREYFITADSSLFYKENSTSTNNNYNNRANLRIEYKIDSFNTLIITPNASFQNNTSSSFIDGINSLQSGQLLSQTINSISTKSNGYNVNNGLLYRHAFQKRGRTISFNLNSSYNKKDGTNYLNAFNSYNKSPLDIADSVVNQFSDRASHGNQYNFNVAYTEPIGKKGQLQVNYNPSFSKSFADQETFQYDSSIAKYSFFDTSLSNKFNSTFNTQNGGITYRYVDRDNQFSAGLAYQYADLKSDQEFPMRSAINKSFVNFLPNVMARFKLSSRSNLRVFYRTSTSPPSVTQLQDVINNSNQFFYTTGNPDLRQQYTHSLVTRFNYTNTLKGTSFFANFLLQSTNDYVANATYIASHDSVLTKTITLFKGSQISKPVNLDGYLSARSFLTYGIPLKFIKTNLNLNAGFSYNKLPGLINNVSNISNSYSYNLGAVLASNISQYVDFTISYSGNINVVKNSLQPQLNNNYFTQTAGLQANLLSKNGWFIQNDLTNLYYSGLSAGYNQSYWLWNAAVGKKFFKSQGGELKLSVFDLLKQNRSIVRNVTESYIEDVRNQVLQQYFMLTFSYKLKNFVKK
jgi:uncharacterized membrane protein YgcG